MNLATEKDVVYSTASVKRFDGHAATAGLSKARRRSSCSVSGCLTGMVVFVRRGCQTRSYVLLTTNVVRRLSRRALEALTACVRDDDLEHG